MLHGCNYISKGTKRSCPFAIFSRDDLLHLAIEMDEWYKAHKDLFPGDPVETIVPAIYGEIVQQPNGTLETTGVKRTGCDICMFGIHLEARPHRFDRLRVENPKAWHFWMYDAGFGKVLDYIGVGWENNVDIYEQLRIDI